ncbi:hypothetical protein [Pseudomonas aeruginosa]|uniref:hypothetical protein n=1 Tax=Pseudomonas aeruginosa TaxID=287 RepID=UPI003F52472A
MVAIVVFPFPVGPHHCDLDGGRETGDDRPRTPRGWNEVEGGWRQLFCFAVQSRRRRKKVGDGRCGKTIEAKPVFGQTVPIEDANGAPVSGNRGNTAMAAVLRLAGIGDAAPVALVAVFFILTVKASSYDPAGRWRARLRLTFAGAGVPGVAGKPLAGRHALPRQADDPSFPALIRPPVEADGKPNLIWGCRNGDRNRLPRLPPRPDGASCEVSAAALALWD